MIAAPTRFHNAVLALVLGVALAISHSADARDKTKGAGGSKAASASSRVAPPKAGARQLAFVQIPPGQAYRQTNLVSDVAGLALLQDGLLVNPWGIALTGSSPFWVANNGSSKARIYREDPLSDVVSVNPGLGTVTIPGSPSGLPTGTVANGSADFMVTLGADSGPARFLFASLTGNISGWSPNVPAGSTAAVIAASHAGHVYTGLAIGNNGVGNFLYAADFANGAIDVHNNVFALQPTASFPFADPTIPNTVGNVYHPHNIQNIGGSLYVTYAKVGSDGEPENGVGNGFVRRFNMNGVRDLTFGINNGPLDAPWGITIASASFGVFGGALLVGNFADRGTIHAFNPTTGAFLGTLQDEGGSPIQIDQLWALTPGNGANGGDVGAVYFTAGIGNEEHGLFGVLRQTTATAASLVQFSTSDYFVNETAGSISITVLRTGDVSGSASVNYAALTDSQLGHAGASDFTLAPGTLTFGPGETSKSFVVAVTNDAIVEGDETLSLVLSNPTGAGLGSPSVATLTIVDNGTGTANLSLVKTGPASALPDAVFTYTLTVANAGPDQATNVIVTDTLPTGVTFISATPSQGSCSGTSTITCTLGTIASGGSATISLTVRAPPLPTTIINTASVTSAQSDPNLANNVSSAIVSTIANERIPTLSDWTLLTLVLMLAALGGRLRRR